MLDFAELSESRHFELIGELFADLLPGIRTVQEVLAGFEDEPNIVYLAIAALGRLGWITEQACELTGVDNIPVVGGAEQWLLGAENSLSALKRSQLSPSTRAEHW